MATSHVNKGTANSQNAMFIKYISDNEVSSTAFLK